MEQYITEEQNNIIIKKNKMAYTQKPGRGSNPKTGHGIPAPFKQTRTGLTPKQNEEIEGVTKLNKFRNVVEAGAKLDSIAAAGARKLSGIKPCLKGLLFCLKLIVPCFIFICIFYGSYHNGVRICFTTHYRISMTCRYIFYSKHYTIHSTY